MMIQRLECTPEPGISPDYSRPKLCVSLLRFRFSMLSINILAIKLIIGITARDLHHHHHHPTEMHGEEGRRAIVIISQGREEYSSMV